MTDRAPGEEEEGASPAGNAAAGPGVPLSGPGADPWAPLAGRALGGAALIVVLATLGSKILGFLRDVFLASVFGATALTDAYNIASMVPLVLFAAVGVSITTVFIPLFAEVLAKRSVADAEVFSARVNGAATLVVAAFIILLEALAAPAIRLAVPQFDPERHAIAVVLLRIMAPLILFYAWSAVVGGVLNVRGFFGPNAAMGIPQNLIIMAAIVIGGLAGGHIWIVAVGSLVGTATTYLVQLPALARSRFAVRWRFDLRDPLLSRMAKLVAPAAATALAQQAGFLANYRIGSGLLAGQLTQLTVASRIQLLAYSILGMSVATVLYPSLATAAATGQTRQFRQTFARGLGLVHLVTVPVMAAMVLLRWPIVDVLFRHGSFTAADAAGSAAALGFLGLGTLGTAWQDYINRAFFAMQNTRVPMLGGFVAVGVTIVLDRLLVPGGRMGLDGLAVGTAAGWLCAATFLGIALRRRLGPLGGRRVAWSGLRMILAALCGFLLAARLDAHLAPPGLHAALAVRAGALLVALVSGGLIYLAACWLLRVEELRPALAFARTLLGRLRRR